MITRNPAKVAAALPAAPNSLVAALAGGAAGGVAGYGAGWLGEKLLPEDRFEPGRLRRTLALAGLGLGAAPGAWGGLARARIPEAGGTGEVLRPEPWLSGYGHGADPEFRKASAAYGDAAGAMHVASIPVDAFNRAVWNDVGGRPNAFGTRSPWGDNEQPMGTPLPVASFTAGAVAAAGTAAGRPHVSPFQVATAAGTAAGVGAIGGMALGRAVGMLAGLRPEAQRELQRAGTWGGLLAGAVGSLFR